MAKQHSTESQTRLQSHRHIQVASSLLLCVVTTLPQRLRHSILLPDRHPIDSI